MNQRGIASALDVSPTAVAKALKGLGNIVKVEKDPKMNLVSVQINRDDKRIVELKRVENLRQVYDSGLLDHLEDLFPGCTIILFGSYSRGEDTIRSDVDIAVIGAKEKNMDLSRFEDLLRRKIIINNYDDLKKINKNLRQNIINGITLQGTIEL